ncbi:RHS repeat-associated core domain-containing protein [Candidatus Uabimicrobium sp. HlEnr_7]|uniref:RHS repeat-associated core domain-containing protein n=1 Tax=Candidatus Uabimicrobium helgolandensis TaxID=3095367 RepID=UPI0035564640
MNKNKYLYLVLYLITSINLYAVDLLLDVLTQDHQHVVSPIGLNGICSVEWELLLTNEQPDESYTVEFAILSASMSNGQLSAFTGNEVGGSFLQSRASFDYVLSESFAQDLPLSGQSVVVNLLVQGEVEIRRRTTNPDGSITTTVTNETLFASNTMNLKFFPGKLQVQESGENWGEIFRFSTPNPSDPGVTISRNDLQFTYDIETNLNTLSVNSFSGGLGSSLSFEPLGTNLTFNGSPLTQRSPLATIPFLGYSSFQIEGRFSYVSDLPLIFVNPNNFEHLSVQKRFCGVYNRRNLTGEWKFEFLDVNDEIVLEETINISDDTPENADFITTKDQIFNLSGSASTSLTAVTSFTFDSSSQIRGPLDITIDFVNNDWQGISSAIARVEDGKIVLQGLIEGVGDVPRFFRAEFNPNSEGDDRDIQRENDGDPVTKEIPFNNPTISEIKIDGSILPTSGNPSNNICDICPCSGEDGGKVQTALVGEDQGDPVNLNNLEFTLTAVDLEIAGRGISYKFERTYRSRINFDSSLGKNWDHNYNMRVVLHPENPGSVILYRGSRGDEYPVIAAGSIISPATHFNLMIENEEGFLLLREANGTVCKFFPLDSSSNEAGHLAEIKNKCGNALTFTYSSEGLLDTVFDSLSRPITYEYENNRIVKIRDFINREIVFEYNNLGQLISTRSPIVTTTPNGNDFPNGKLTEYVYSSGFEDDTLNHNLVEIISPNEVNSNIAKIKNFYDAEDRIFRQEWGGTNASGVVAGGTIFYSREIVNEGVDLSNLDLPREVVTTIDRRGNEVLLSYNIAKNLIKKQVKTRGIRQGDPQEFVTTYKYNDSGLQIEEIRPEGGRIVTEYDENAANIFQRGNVISVTHFPDARGGDQQFLKVAMEYEPIFNQVISQTEQRSLTSGFIPANGGAVTPDRYKTTLIPDYFEGDLDTPGCGCGFTLREITETFAIDISSIEDKLGLGDINEDNLFNICGNIIVTKSPNVKLLDNSLQASVEGSATQVIETRISYGKFGQILKTETAEGEITEYFYYPANDPDGDGADILDGLNHLDEQFDPQGGYLREVIVDSAHSSRYRGNVAPTKLSTKFGYDRVGNKTFVIDPRGIKSQFIYNELNQLVEAVAATDISEAVEPNLVAFAYKSRLFYDENNNVVRTEVEYRDGNNPDLPDFIETTTTYDILDNPISTTQRVDNTKILTTEMVYDENDNLVEIRSPLAASGIDPNNIKRTEYDERDLIHRVIQSPGTTEESIVTSNYDLNGNIVEVIDAEDTDGDGENEKTIIIYDGFDRSVRSVDSVGNVTDQKYDPASNVIETSTFGLVGGASRTGNDTTGNVLLSRSHIFHDELSRVFKTESELFISEGINLQRAAVLNEDDANPGDGRITSFIDYDRNSRTTFATSASPNNAQEISKIEYDGASRAIRAEDSENNIVQTEYDKSNNPIRITTTEVNSAGRIIPESFTTISVFDSLNRKIRVTDNIGQTSYLFYDSRNMLIKVADSQGPEIADPLGLFSGNINDLGNINEFIQDGIGRTIQTIKELAVDGQGGNPLDVSNPSNIDGKITETNIWDDNSRLISVQDDNLNTTSYEYDSLNRQIKTIFADGKFTTNTYSKDHNVTSHTDNNGNVCSYIYDGINRVLEKNIARSVVSNIGGTTQQTFEYDGLSRLIVAIDNNNPSDTNDDSTVTRNYDSLSRMLEETQNGKVISMNWREEGDLAECIYPNNRKISYNYDKIDRLISINEEDSTTIASFDYIGSRVLERVYKNNTRLTTLNDTGDANIGYDNLPRLAQMRHLRNGSNELITGYAYGYNRVNFKEHKVNLKNPQFSELYELDSLYRVVDFKRGTLAAGNDAINGTATQTQDWQLDGVGNWANTAVDGTQQTQSVNNMNEYNSFNGVTFVHDDNGNLADDGERLFAYDALNRIIEIRSKEDNSVIATYKYDYSNRRIEKNFQTKTAGECNEDQGELTPDANTLLLYHYNNETGPIVDSSGNGLDITKTRNTSRDDGLFNTRSLRFNGKRLTVPSSSPIDNIQDQLTVETFVFLDPTTPEQEDELGGALVKRRQSYRLKINRNSRKPVFVIDTVNLDGTTTRTRVRGDIEIPLRTWVHLAGIYDGQTVKLFVNGVEQQKVKNVTGNIAIDPTIKTRLANGKFFGLLEETRISNVARIGCDPGEIVTRDIRRNFFYSDWRVIEQRQQTGEVGQQLGDEIVSRQFVDGNGIDEHLQLRVFNGENASEFEELYFHENARGDVVALTNDVGDIALALEYSSYGVPYVVDDAGELEEFADFESVVYGFQGRRIDEETSLMYFRNRFYNPEAGRWLQRDPLGYVDSYGLYEAFGGNPFNYSDPYGLDHSILQTTQAFRNKERREAQAKIDARNQLTRRAEMIKQILKELKFANLPKTIDTNCELRYTLTGMPIGTPGNRLFSLGAKGVQTTGQFAFEISPFADVRDVGSGAQSIFNNPMNLIAYAGFGWALFSLASPLDNFSDAGKAYKSLADTDVVGLGKLTHQEAIDIQKIADHFNTRIEVGGSRATGKGRNTHNPELPSGKGPGTRSDIDFIYDKDHPQADALFDMLHEVGGVGGEHMESWSIFNHDYSDYHTQVFSFVKGKMPVIRQLNPK